VGTELNKTFSKEEIQMAKKKKKKNHAKMLTVPGHKGKCKSKPQYNLISLLLSVPNNVYTCK
jgi:hypothetical protein